MLDIKSKNLFIRKNGDYNSNYTIAKIIDFYDLTGMNVLYMSPKDVDLSGFLKAPKITFKESTFEEVLKKNLFRVDILVIDSITSIDTIYNISRKITDIPIIFISNDSFIDIKSKIIDNFDTVYVLSKKNRFNTGNQLVAYLGIRDNEDNIVQDIKNGWESNLKELKKQYIREKKINDIFGDNE